MFIPLGVVRPCRKPTLATYIVMGLCVGVYLAQQALSTELRIALLEKGWLSREERSALRAITYQFLHSDDGPLHLAGNMLFLWVFGPSVEDKLGRLGFTAFYLLGGAAAGLAHLATTPAPVIGASGSIAALTAAFLVFFPRTHVRVLLGLVLIGVFTVPSTWFVILAVAMDLLWRDPGVAHEAHLGGYAFGFGVCMTLLATNTVRREPFDLLKLCTQARRRRRFQSLAEHGKNSSGAPKKQRTQRQSAADTAAANARTLAAELASRGELDGAAKAYATLAAAAPDAALHSDAQLAIANHLHQTGAAHQAADAYERFLNAYPTDHRGAEARVLLAILLARYLNEPKRAEAHIRAALKRLPEGDEKQLARRILQELPADNA